MAHEQFSLVWNSFPTNLSSGLYSLLTDQHLVDVTLAAEGKILRAHKLILSVCSTYFRDLFKGNTCKHPIVILKDVNYRDLSAMLDFMYQGEVNIKQEDIASFLKVAETLQIKGLTKDKTENIQNTDSLPGDDSEILMESDNKINTSDDPQCPSETTNQFDNFPHSLKQSEQFSQQNSLPLDDSKDIKLSPNSSNVDSDFHTTIVPTFNENYENSAREISATADDEPLDFTPDNREFVENNDFKFAVAPWASSAAIPANNPDEIQSTTVKDKPSELDSTEILDDNTYTEEVTPKSSKSTKGRRTVKGISHSTLPLETTLRVVSQIGPTLRVERGKVVRMYSCPWCLRHFTRKENLKLHVRYIHGPLESLTCKICGNHYKNPNSLRVHSYLYHNTKRTKHNKPIVMSNT